MKTAVYIKNSVCISAQATFPDWDPETLNSPVENILRVIEPSYPGIPNSLLRRMGKAVRLGTGAALEIMNYLKEPEGIVIGTANGGMEDCIRFLNQIVQFEEGRLTPTSFVQSTANAIASQIAMLSGSHAYNVTHVHRGLAFENALMDAMLLTNGSEKGNILVAGVDEVSDYNHHIEQLAGTWKKETIASESLYETLTPGTIAGEGIAAFELSSEHGQAKAGIIALQTFHSSDPVKVEAAFTGFYREHFTGDTYPDVFLSPENGDSRLLPIINKLEDALPSAVGIARFKHYFGEFPSVSALSLWLAHQFLIRGSVPGHFIKRPVTTVPRSIVLWNTYKGEQHSWMIVERV